MSQAEVNNLIELLQHKSSPRRRSAAKKLRKIKDKSAGPVLLTALKNEVEDKRTWETQYQMIMALGECGYTESLGFLTQLSEHEFEATMVYVAIGDTLIRLHQISEKGVEVGLDLLNNSDNSMLIDGVLRAFAMLKLVPCNTSVERVIDYGLSLNIDDGTRAWIAAAAAGWETSSTDTFLNQCKNSTNQQTRRAAEAALSKKYLKWSPL